MKITTTAERKTTTETLTDNSVEQHKALASFILKNAPGGLEASTRDELRFMSETGVHDRRIFLKFLHPGVMTVEMNAGYSERLGRVEDAAGDIFSAYKFETTIIFAGHGATETMLALRRLALMQEVTVFALMLEHEFTAPLYELSATKAEREADAEAEARRANVEKLRAHIANSGDALKGMRVGDTRFLATLADVPKGAYEVKTVKCCFRVSVDPEATLISVLRTA